MPAIRSSRDDVIKKLITRSPLDAVNVARQGEYLLELTNYHPRSVEALVVNYDPTSLATTVNNTSTMMFAKIDESPLGSLMGKPYVDLVYKALLRQPVTLDNGNLAKFLSASVMVNNIIPRGGQSVVPILSLLHLNGWLKSDRSISCDQMTRRCLVKMLSLGLDLDPKCYEYFHANWEAVMRQLWPLQGLGATARLSSWYPGGVVIGDDLEFEVQQAASVVTIEETSGEWLEHLPYSTLSLPRRKTHPVFDVVVREKLAGGKDLYFFIQNKFSEPDSTTRDASSQIRSTIEKLPSLPPQAHLCFVWVARATSGPEALRSAVSNLPFPVVVLNLDALKSLYGPTLSNLASFYLRP